VAIKCLWNQEKGDKSAEEKKKMGAKMENKRRVRVEPAGWERSMGGQQARLKHGSRHCAASTVATEPGVKLGWCFRPRP